MEQYQKTAYQGFDLRIYKGETDKDLLQKCCREDLERDPDFQLISSSLYSRVFRFRHNRKDYFYKAFLDRDIFESLKAMFRGSRARRSLQGDQLLLKHGFKAPRCILIGSRGNYNFSISEAAPNARNLSQFVREELGPELNRNQIVLKKQLINRLGQIIGQLHARGIFHGDLRWGNILIQESPRLDIWFLDNERTSWYGGKFPCKKRLKNLVQINMTLNPVVTSADRLAFLNAYLQENGELLPRRDELAAKIQQRTEARLAKYNAGLE